MPLVPKKKQFKNLKYLLWIATKPCVVCGYVPREGYSNAAHHIGDGVHSKRFNDYYTVPVCDWFKDPASNNCHHVKVHKSLKKYSNLALLCPDFWGEWEEYASEVISVS